MRDFDVTRTNAIVIINKTGGLRKCVAAILRKEKAVDVQDLHIYIDTRVPLTRIDEEFQKLNKDGPVLMDTLPASKLKDVFTEVKAHDTGVRIMCYANTSRATMHGIHKVLAREIDVPLADIRKAPWMSVCWR